MDNLPGISNLYPYVEAALRPDSPGLDVKAIIADASVRDSDVRSAISYICDAFSHPQPPLENMDRPALVKTLNQSIADALIAPSSLHAKGDVTPNSSSSWVKANGDNGLYIESQRQSNLNAGPSESASNRILRSLRHSAGWVSQTNILKGMHRRPVMRDTDYLRQTYIDKLIENGMPPQEAENNAQSNYIAVTQHYKKNNQGHPDHESPTNKWIDFSPRALEDFHQLRAAKPKRSEPGLAYMLERWGIASRAAHNPERDQLVTVIQRLREADVQRRIGEGLSPDKADHATSEHYIQIVKLPAMGAYKYQFRGDSMEHIDAEMHKLFPNRQPKNVPMAGRQVG